MPICLRPMRIWLPVRLSERAKLEVTDQAAAVTASSKTTVGTSLRQGVSNLMRSITAAIAR